MKSKTYIIGGGIAGLLAGYYLKHPIITQEIGGQLNNLYHQGSLYFYQTEQIIDFLGELKIDFNYSLIKVGYKAEGVISNSVNKNFVKNYAEKTGRDKNQKGLLNSHVKYIRICEFDFKDLINKLQNKTDIIQEKIIKIDLDKKNIITQNREYKFDNLICCLPLPVFFKLTDIKLKLKYSAITFCAVDNIINLKEFNYVYSLTDSFYRATQHDDYQVLEFIGKHSEKSIKSKLKKYKNFKILSIFSVGIGKIQQDKPDLSYLGLNNIKFLGRYAEFDSSAKIHNVLDEVVKMKNERA